MHAVCPESVNTPNKSISCLQACGRHGALFAKEGFEFLLLSFPTLAPQNGDHCTLISYFTGVNSPFSTASAVSPYSPSSPIPQSGSPTGKCPARRCLPDWAFRGVSVSPWQLLAPCASLCERLADSTQATASHTPEHPPEDPSLHRPLYTWPWFETVASVIYQIAV